MPNLGFSEMMILLVVALLVFGPRKLPELGRSLGQVVRSFRRSTQGLGDGLTGGLGGSASQQPVSQRTMSQPVPVRATTGQGAVDVPAPLPLLEPVQRD